MSSIRARLQFFSALALAATIYFAYLAYQNHKAIRLVQSELVRNSAHDALMLQVRYEPFKLDTYRKLQALRRDFVKTKEKTRADGLGWIVQAYAAHDAVRLQEKIDKFNLSETQRETRLQNELEAGLSESQRYASIAFLCAILSFASLIAYVNRKILAPIDDISRRMMDFLVDRYSFNFSHPEASELGDLERTFNSLAQQVINTMDDLKNLDQAKSEFLNIASHELRTPLTSI